MDPTSKRNAKTYNSRYSLVVTHPTTNLPIYSLSSGERTGSSVFCNLWSYVTIALLFVYIYPEKDFVLQRVRGVGTSLFGHMYGKAFVIYANYTAKIRLHPHP